MSSNLKKPIPYRLKFALDSWGEWHRDISVKPTVVKELSGGKTNNSWLLESNRKRFVARLNNPISGILGIDRKQEKIIHSLVAKNKISPAYLYWHTPSNTSIFEYVDGECLAINDLAAPRYREKLIEIVDRYQQLKVDLPRFDYYDYLSRYWKKVEMVKPVLANEYRPEWTMFFERLNAFCRQGWTPVITHHDLEPSNILMTDTGIKIIDWEYAGNGHPSFDRLYLHRCAQNQPDILTDVIYWLGRLWGALYEYGHGHPCPAK